MFFRTVKHYLYNVLLSDICNYHDINSVRDPSTIGQHDSEYLSLADFQENDTQKILHIMKNLQGVKHEERVIHKVSFLPSIAWMNVTMELV